VNAAIFWLKTPPASGIVPATDTGGTRVRQSMLEPGSCNYKPREAIMRKERAGFHRALWRHC